MGEPQKKTPNSHQIFEEKKEKRGKKGRQKGKEKETRGERGGEGKKEGMACSVSVVLLRFFFFFGRNIFAYFYVQVGTMDQVKVGSQKLLGWKFSCFFFFFWFA